MGQPETNDCQWKTYDAISLNKAAHKTENCSTRKATQNLVYCFHDLLSMLNLVLSCLFPL